MVSHKKVVLFLAAKTHLFRLQTLKFSQNFFISHVTMAQVFFFQFLY